jgi:hypothetical protein
VVEREGLADTDSQGKEEICTKGSSSVGCGAGQ